MKARELAFFLLDLQLKDMMETEEEDKEDEEEEEEDMVDGETIGLCQFDPR